MSKILIAHAKDEERFAELIAIPLREMGYDVIHEGTIFIGDSMVVEASKLLSEKTPVILCATSKAIGTRWARQLVNAARRIPGVRIFGLQMEEDADIELLTLDEKYGRYWENAGGALNELKATLMKHYPLASPQKNDNNNPAELKVTFLHDYCLPKKFVAREKEIDFLKAIINEKKNPDKNEKITLLAIVAMGGTGKTCLIRKLVDEIEVKNNSFTNLIWFSFYDTKTEDESYFFKKILEVIDPNFEQFYKDFLADLSARKDLKDPDAKNELSEAIHLKERVFRLMDEIPVLFFLDGLKIIQNIVDEKAHNYGRVSSKFSQINSFLRHICNNKKSLVILTTRLGLSNFHESEGYYELELNTFSIEEGAEFLKGHNVIGSNKELMECSSFLGNHALCLKAAGLYLGRLRIPCHSLQRRLMGKNIFSNSKEGEKLVRILELFRQDRLLTNEQEYFLKMLSITSRPITDDDFKVLVVDFNHETRNKIYVQSEIIEPLLKLGLIDEIVQPDNTCYYTVHPLLKFAYQSWFDDSLLHQSYEIWAEAAEAKGMQRDLDRATLIEHIQDLIDAADYYSKAKNVRGIVKIFLSKYESFIALNGVLLQSNKSKALWQEYMNLIEKEMVEESIFIADYDKMKFYTVYGLGAENLKKKAEYLEKALDLSRQNGEYKTEEKLLIMILEVYINIGLVKKASEFLRKNARILRYDVDFKVVLAMLNYTKGKYEKAIKILEQESASAVNHEKTKLAWKLAPCLIRLGKYNEAENLLDGLAEEPCESCRSNILKAYILLEIKKDNLEKAREYYKCYQDLHQNFNNPLALVSFDTDYIFDLLELLSGECHKIIKNKEEKYSSKNELETIVSEGVSDFILLAKAYLDLGNYAKAEFYFNKMYDLAEKNDFWRYQDDISALHSKLFGAKN